MTGDMEAQPKPESWQEIAREAAEDFLHSVGWFDHTTEDEKEQLSEAFLEAIERSHAPQPQREPLVEALEGIRNHADGHNRSHCLGCSFSFNTATSALVKVKL